MSKIRLELKAGYLKDLEDSREMLNVLEKVARAVASEAQRIAPVGGYAHGGRYRDNIKPDAGQDDKGPVGRVNAHYFTSWWLEAGTSRTRAFSPLRKAMESGAARGVLS